MNTLSLCPENINQYSLISSCSIKPISYISFYLLGLFTFISNSSAAITASSIQTIQGHAPILSLGGGVNAIGSLGEFLEVTASDGTVYTSDNTLDPMVTVQPTETFSLYITQIEVDEFGNVKLLAKPTKTAWPSTVRISVTPKADISGTGMSHTTQVGLWVVSSIHNDPEQWDGVNVITLEEAQLYCQNLGGILPIRADFTNSPYANSSLYLENSQLPQSIGYQLANWDSDRNSPASISLISEWGNLYNTYSPPNTDFSNSYRISEAYFMGYKKPFVVDIDTGSIITNSIDGGKSGVACLYD